MLTIKNVIIYLIVINVVGFLAMYIDKKKAKRYEWRISEKNLLLIALMGGSIGSMIGMYTFRHKTKKAKFFIGIPFFFIFQILIVVYAIKNNVIIAKLM